MPTSSELLPIDRAKLPLYAGIDVGGTNIKIGLIDEAGRTVAFTKTATDQHEGPQRAAERTAFALAELQGQIDLAPGAVVRAGLATPGPMDLEAGILLQPGNLPAWHNSPVRQLFASACKLPVTYANDANAAAFGEYWAGAGADVQNMVLVTLGTGVGGGIIINERLLHGSHGAGGEIGHIVIDCHDDAPANTLGLRGTLEGYVGSYSLIARMRQALATSDRPSELRNLADDDFTPLAVANAAESGDSLALGVIMDTAKYLAIGLATAIHTVDPERVVIGGAMTFGGAGHTLGEKFLDEVRRQTRLRIFESLRDAVTIDFARLGGDAGYIGAAGLARQEHLQS